MNVYKTEEEQVEDLKRWLKSYGPSIVVGICLALAISFGWKFYKSYKTHQAIAASTIYQRLLSANDQKQYDDVKKASHEIMDTYAHSPYAALSGMMLAKLAIQDNDIQEAVHQLSWVIEHSSDENLLAIAKLRKARLELLQKKYAEAETTLNDISNPQFSGLVSATKGDIFNAQKQYAKAKVAYETALQQISLADDVLPILRIKLENLPITQGEA